MDSFLKMKIILTMKMIPPIARTEMITTRIYLMKELKKIKPETKINQMKFTKKNLLKILKELHFMKLQQN
jgi:hypothetical protein